MSSLQQQWLDAFNQLQELSNQLKVGDPFNYNRGREIHTTFILGLTISDTLAGADAYLGDKPVELKSTIGPLQATYNGVSIHPTWEEQERYLIEDKLGKYPYHYITRYEGSELVEAYRLTSDDVLSLLLPKFKKQYHTKRVVKDPRANAKLTGNEIKTYGERIK